MEPQGSSWGRIAKWRLLKKPLLLRVASGHAPGEVKMPLTKTFWSRCFGMVQDKFGVGWMVTVFPPAQK